MRGYISYEIKRWTQTNWNVLGPWRACDFRRTLATINHQSAYIGLRTTNLLYDVRCLSLSLSLSLSLLLFLSFSAHETEINAQSGRCVPRDLQ